MDDDPFYAKLVCEWLSDIYQFDMVADGTAAIAFLANFLYTGSNEGRHESIMTRTCPYEAGLLYVRRWCEATFFL